MSSDHENPLHNLCLSPLAQGHLETCKGRPNGTAKPWRGSNISRDTLSLCGGASACKARSDPRIRRPDRRKTTRSIRHRARQYNPRIVLSLLFELRPRFSPADGPGQCCGGPRSPAGRCVLSSGAGLFFGVDRRESGRRHCDHGVTHRRIAAS